MKKQIIMLIVGSVVMLGVFILNSSNSKGEAIVFEPKVEEVIPLVVDQTSNEMNLIEEVFIVDVKGEVNEPGIYVVDSSSRIHEVIQLAGGFTVEANSNQINLAQRIKDEMVIYVPHVNEDIELIWESTASTNSPDQSKVSLNRATLEQLQTLPGIGQSKATAIINYRTEVGPFKSIEELVNVSGIGAKTLESLRDLLEL